ncbi:GspE/PulE family protein [Vampirovibrio sp.]|uniref:GspE/PulE family protein n=1 Tax=Vampirovibrio sp. TaxID=2717857 RepID=UPI0035935C02
MTDTVPPAAAASRPARRRIGEILQESGLINEQDLSHALTEAKQSGQFIGLVLVKAGKITTEQLGQALAVQYGLKYANIVKMPLNPELMSLLPDEFIRDKQVVPIAKERGRLVVAMVNPGNREIIDEITFITGMRPLVAVTTSIEFLEFCNKNMAESSTSSLKEEISSFSGQLREQNKELDTIKQQRDAELTDASNPLIKLVNSIIEEGIERNASDIHIEPRPKKYLVRFRVDGILRTILDVPQNMEASFVTRIKVMARMDIAEHRRPQDGRITIKYKGSEYNLRVNTLPVSDNREKIVIRILRPSKNISDFKALGFDEEDIRKLEYLYKSPYGIILVCGPTGSGKTTTLYTVLQRINDDIRNICTVEDPVELQIEGLNQSQVNPKADYTFASSMRALLRQDPDVIMVGEIRDYETLEAAVHAALTGHLVFSTIHSNTTAATITRMIEMGAASNLIGSALVGVLAQRLVRNICPYCKTAYEASSAEKALLFPSAEEAKRVETLMLYKGKGCELCMNSGYAGRSGVYEILIVDREIRQLINDSHSDLEIEDAAVAAGMKSLGMNGRAKVLNGVTTVEEVIRVLGVNLGGQ